MRVDFFKNVETWDVDLLKKTLSEMDPKEAEECMKRCIATGLWVENAADAEAQSQHENKNASPKEELNTAEDEDAVVRGEREKANAKESVG